MNMTKLYPPKLFYCQNPLFDADRDNDLMEIKSLFEKAVAATNAITGTANKKTLMKLYSLYNQATKGDIDMAAPAAYDCIEREKYEAWASLKGKSVKDAQCEYILLVHKLKN